MFEDWVNMCRGLITAMVASTQMQHQQQREVLEVNRMERERHWKQIEEDKAREDSEIARVSAQAAAETAALNKIGTALERIAAALEASKP